MKNRFVMKSLPVAALAATVFLAAGCGRDNVQVYQVATNDTVAVPPPPAAAAGAMPASMPAGLPAPDNSGLPALKYNLPAGWKEKPLTQMRVASFEISENGQTADVSVIPLGGMAGGDLANVNRWRGQVNLPPLADAELQKLAEKIEVAGQPADLFDVAGTSPGSGDTERILGVILHRDDMAWFFKLIGPAALAEKNKPALVAFLKTLQFAESPAAPATDASQLPPSHPPISGLTPAETSTSSAAAGDKPTWIVPAGWQEGELAQFLVDRFVIKGGGSATATVNVSQLAGDGGGLLPNVNRWRKQLGLEPVTAADLAKLDTLETPSGKAAVVEISGTDMRSQQPAQLVGVVLPVNGQTWFYKLAGDAAVVAQQKAALLKFVQSAKYPNAN